MPSAVFGLFSLLGTLHRQIRFLIVIIQGLKTTSVDARLHFSCFSFFILTEANV